MGQQQQQQPQQPAPSPERVAPQPQHPLQSQGSQENNTFSNGYPEVAPAHGRPCLDSEPPPRSEPPRHTFEHRLAEEPLSHSQQAEQSSQLQVVGRADISSSQIGANEVLELAGQV